ncbi:putative cell wall synthesis protein KRE9 [Elsinoe australis]|uniref:Putative cell wall synthesis protein KRE9 n=1 Tax=Elsinoe australis TaxID=40998 RepID=A0A2P7YDA4_9PEZI|nr:hypothetical protein B9Z65_8272 [Elsinoe australis]TKX25364.1 putative cell wall synthesis protein KRE9 [Elsinoe australis]
MRLSTSLIFASLLSFISAEVTFTTPAAGGSVPGGGSISVQWTYAGTPAISTFTTYQLFLMAGGNDGASMQQVAVLVPNGVVAQSFSSAQAVVQPGVGGTQANAYFLKMMLTSSSGGQLINYSDRFTLTGMTGTFPANVLAGINAISGTAGPANEDQITNDAGAGAGDSGNAVPYSLQSGLTRYAPMQPVPPTKITAKTWTPLFPTSAFTVATTYFPRPSIVTTITASQTFSVSSVENTIAAASQPGSNAQQRFLNRWKD